MEKNVHDSFFSCMEGCVHVHVNNIRHSPWGNFFKKILFIPVVKDFIYICHGVLWYCLNYINNSKLVENPDSS